MSLFLNGATSTSNIIIKNPITITGTGAGGASPAGSIEFWFYVKDDNQRQNIFTMYTTAGNPYITFFVIQGAFVIYVQDYIGNYNQNGDYLNKNTWYHVYINLYCQNVIDPYDSRAIIYINGTQIQDSSMLATDVNNSHIAFGFDPLNASNNNFYVYNVLIRPSFRYTANFTPDPILPADTTPYMIIIIAKPIDNVIGGGEVVRYYISNTSGTFKDNATLKNVVTFVIMPGPAPATTICFVAGTPVLTDQEGYVAIEQLVPGRNTINGNRILAITESVTPERHLARIPAGALADGSPSADTLMSLNHRIKLPEGSWLKSYESDGSWLKKDVPDGSGSWLKNDVSDGSWLKSDAPGSSWLKSYDIAAKLGGTYVDYLGEILYNVLLGDVNGTPIAGTMTVNNMEVETLDPDNLMAKVSVLLKDATHEQRIEIIQALNAYTRQMFN